MADLFERLNQKNRISQEKTPNQPARTNKEVEKEIERLKSIIQTNLPKYIDKNLFGMTTEEERNQIKHYMRKIIKEQDTFLRNTEIESFLDPFILDLTSLGKISHFMEDEKVSEIMVNKYDEIWIDIGGKKIKTDIKFDSEEETMELAQKIARNVGRLIDASHPYVDARLPDMSRVHIIIPPLSRKGVTITIRKFFKEKLRIQDLIDLKTLSPEMAKFLKTMVVSRANLIVSGGTGSGKTTTLNILSNFVPNHERIITIEDSAELQLHNEHVVSLETKDANAEGQGEVDMQELVKNSLRMYPDRIIVGEVRDKTAYDLLNAMSTGHEGSMSTVHANDPENCITRLTNLVSERNLGFSTDLIRRIIGQSVDIIIQIQRMRDHVRRITHISQVYIQDDKVIVEPIFEFKYGDNFQNNGQLIGEFVRTDTPISNRLKNKLVLAGINPEQF